MSDVKADEISKLLRVVQKSAPTAFKSELDGRTAHGVIGDAADLLPVMRAEIIALSARVAELKKALKPFVKSYEHTTVFLGSRQKMNRVGRDIYLEDVNRARKTIAGQ